jgi:capsular exopolysaccharide synthesis family protein
MPEFSGRRDLRSQLLALRRWRYVFLVILVAAPLITYLLERGKPTVYQSAALVGVTQESSSGSVLSGGSDRASRDIDAVARLVTTMPIADLAGRKLSPPVPGRSIVGHVSASANPIADFITIKATDGTPGGAAAIANAFATALMNRQQSKANGQIKSTIARYQGELAHLSRGTTRYATLQTEISELQTSLSTPGADPSIFQAAKPNTTPSGPHVARAVELGFVAGLLLAIAVVLLADGLDRRMRPREDLDSLTDLSVLAALAPSAFTDGLESTPEDEETFQMLRSSITYSTASSGHGLSSVMVTSAGEREGKSTVAAKLALASARAGLDVVLVDGDLRSGGVSGLFGMRMCSGLGDVLESRGSADHALTERPLAESGAGRLRILPAGPPPADPAALMNSDHLRTVISSLQTQSDLVIVDTPAALTVSDAEALMDVVNGIVLVARMHHSNRETISRLQKLIESTHGHLLGVVATGVPSTRQVSGSGLPAVALQEDLQRQQRPEGLAVVRLAAAVLGQQRVE